MPKTKKEPFINPSLGNTEKLIWIPLDVLRSTEQSDEIAVFRTVILFPAWKIFKVVATTAKKLKTFK